ncbi:MAG: hypothetical protein GF320_21450 [Armatimonadia bacterium]|nr:hypothetical protein [Armatimonadia bacterium]
MSGTSDPAGALVQLIAHGTGDGLRYLRRLMGGLGKQGVDVIVLAASRCQTADEAIARCDAIEMLGQIDTPQARTALRRLCKSPDRELAEMARSARRRYGVTLTEEASRREEPTDPRPRR